MPINQTSGGIFTGSEGLGAMAHRQPDQCTNCEVIAESRNGGTLPDPSVSNASSAHMATAEKPIMSPVPYPALGAGLPRYFFVSSLLTLTVTVPISVPTVAYTGAYTPVEPSGAKATTILLSFSR